MVHIFHQYFSILFTLFDISPYFSETFPKPNFHDSDKFAKQNWTFPIFHQLHPGNIHDSKMFNEAIANIKLFGIHKGVIVYDRGIGSKNSTSELSNASWKIIVGMPMHTGIKHIITKMDFEDIENLRNRVVQGITTFYVPQLPILLIFNLCCCKSFTKLTHCQMFF